ncbi:MAG: sulfite exporter TauE/SafE family protein, partial [Mycolicibacterium sp.]|nr:sulfite exporter TauE/SafE family protein [Mycolicibacterium sp.]
LSLTGSIDGDTWRWFAFLVPATVVGYALSRWANRLLNQQRQRWTAIAVSAAGAGVLVVQQLGAL